MFKQLGGLPGHWVRSLVLEVWGEGPHKIECGSQVVHSNIHGVPTIFIIRLDWALSNLT